MMHRVAETSIAWNQAAVITLCSKGVTSNFAAPLKTTDRKLADRRLTELRAQIGNLPISDDARLSFDEIAARWMNPTNSLSRTSSNPACILSPITPRLSLK